MSSNVAVVESEFGALPLWNLNDLYPGMDSAEYAADLARAEAECKAFSARYAGKLAGIATGPGAVQDLFHCIRTYESIEDLLGRIMSYAGLIYATDTTNPAHAKFYGDAQERITNASAELLFFSLELNRLDDSLINSLSVQSPLSHYKPWIDDTRIERPYQLEDSLEKLFLEKSVTGSSAWNRLFDETIAGLRFKVGDEELAIEPTLNKMQDKDPAVRKLAAKALGVTL